MNTVRPLTRRSVVAVACVIAVALVACTPERGETDEADVAPTQALPEVTAPPERRTPFCVIMLDLDLSLPEDQTADVTDQVLDAYRKALPVAPPEISAELEAVIVGLETGTEPTLPPITAPPVSDPSSEAADEETTPSAAPDPGGGVATSTTSPGEATFTPVTEPTTASTFAPPSSEEIFDEEGYVPDDNPTVRLNEYVDFACRDNINNPGPPATQPSATPVPLLDGERIEGEIDR